MRERINRLAKGILDVEFPEFKIVSSDMGETVRAGGVVKREIYIGSENNMNIKGLAYSSNIRVKILNSAFGGLRNHIYYEIDSSYLEDEDMIKGSFYLVTNAGEKEIPYSFRVEQPESGKTLGGLETESDFADLASKDLETALRLFEYQDFTQAPFMKDMQVRTLYDGLKGRPDRKNQLEEFLTALGAKEPVEFKLDEKIRIYENPVDRIEDYIVIEKSHWGCLSIEVSVDGVFIEIPKKVITDGDFKDGKYSFQYVIHPQRLHRGKNLGSLSFFAPKQQFFVPIEAMGDETVVVSEEEEQIPKENLWKYMTLRLDYEKHMGEEALSVNDMTLQIQEMEITCPHNDLVSLLYAENQILAGKTAQACLLLDECRDSILASRQEQIENYCFYQYLQLLVEPNEHQKESLIRLLNKYLGELKKRPNLFFLRMKLDDALKDNTSLVFQQLKRLHLEGCHSPFLYSLAFRLLNEDPALLRSLDGFEIQCLNRGIKDGVFGEDLALKVAKMASGFKYFNRLFFRVISMIYNKYNRKELLTAICCLLIKGECRQPFAFFWYETGLKEGIGLTRLYEYYLYALPEDYNRLLPQEVLLYFSYGNELDQSSKAVLYENIIMHMKNDSPLYKEYERGMEKFAMEQLFQSRIDSHLAVIYDRMIYKNIIDLPVAKVLPSILRSCLVECENKRMKYVVVCCEELTDCAVYPLENGRAFIPLFSDRDILLFQDAYGNRFGSIPYSKVQALDKPELEKRCFLIYPDHPMLRLKRCGEILKQGFSTPGEALLLEQALEEMNLHPLYQKKLISLLVESYKRLANNGEKEQSASFFIRLDKKSLSKAERAEVCETLISQNHMKEAYEMIREFGWEEIRTRSLCRLCTGVILQNMFDQNDILLKLSYRVFDRGRADTVILDYLCEHFNGLSDQMYRVLLQGVKERVETYDLEERLTAQMLFSGKTERIDKVFELYATRKKTVESIVKAYFTIKGADYFLKNHTPGDKVFAYLESAVISTSEKERIPIIYLLALSKYYGSLKNLQEDQKNLCQAMVTILLEEDLVFPYFKNLAKFVPMPEDVTDKGMIEYHGDRESRIELMIRILPDEEEFTSEDMRRVYQGIFVKQKILFEGEIMEYRIYELQGEARKLKAEGSVDSDVSYIKTGESRYGCLNEMGLCLGMKEEDALKKNMREYVIKNVTVEDLFPLL